MIGWNEDIKKELKYCGENVYIGQNVVFTNPKEVILHDNVRIDPFTLITTALEVGNSVLIQNDFLAKFPECKETCTLITYTKK